MVVSNSRARRGGGPYSTTRQLDNSTTRQHRQHRQLDNIDNIDNAPATYATGRGYSPSHPGVSRMVHVSFGKMLTACSTPPCGDAIEAFVHRVTGEVLFITEGDEAAAQHFCEVARNLANLCTALVKSLDWLAVPKHNGPVIELKAFMLAWCDENGFTVD